MSDDKKEQNDLVSIVIPVYNTYNCLRKCIESVREQTYQWIEILLVDDGSTDNSSIVCDIYEEMDERIRVIHKKRGGLSDSCNTGIRVAKGRYITFVNSGDYILPNYIWHLVELIKIEGTDIAVTCVTKYLERHRVREKYNLKSSKLLTSEEALADMFYEKNIPIYLNAKIYKRELFETVHFLADGLPENLNTIFSLFLIAGQIAFNPVFDYCYFHRESSITNTNSCSDKMVQIATTENIIEFMRLNHPRYEGAAITKCFNVTLGLYQTMSKEPKYLECRTYAEEVIKKYRKMVLKDGNNKLPIRIIALFSFLSIKGIVCVGKGYQYLVDKND